MVTYRHDRCWPTVYLAGVVAQVPAVEAGLQSLRRLPESVPSRKTSMETRF